jgi:acyl transferase domain-containing protein/SAM-dependent methyltransferase/aryl carrier-like protein
MVLKADVKEQLSPIQRALVQQRKLQARLEEAEARLRAPIAVIGLGCRFPGAPNPGAFWELLRNGVDAVDAMPADRWDVDSMYEPDTRAPGKFATRWGGFLQGVDEFDAGFFGIARREASSMDPQQRLLLEVAWEALENAGQASTVRGTSTGVYVGVSTFDYAQLESRLLDLDQFDAYSATGYSHSVLSGRLAYTLGLHGPAISVDTACSSSLVAIHLACQAVRSGDCRMALAGGVNHILAAENLISLSKANMMASDGRCKTFDAAADGFVRAEGCGMVVLKRLSDANSDGDRVLAVIRGSATNQDGRSTGLTVPNGPAQEAVIRRALENAGVEPAEVSYLETHGTGTKLGDPIEVQALAEVLGEGRAPHHTLWLGSVKTNVGHLESAAGVCSLIKVVLALQHNELPASLHFREPNPHIAWGDYPFLQVAAERVHWGRSNRVAGVSSFGFSGTNAHIILGEAPAPVLPAGEAEVDPPERPSHVLVLSGRTHSALRDLAAEYVVALQDMERAPGAFADVCHTAGAGRSHFEHRLAVTANSAAEARASLADFLQGGAPATLSTGSCVRGHGPRVGFLFPGQGAQSAGMGRELYETQPTFRHIMDECAEILADVLDKPLLDVLYSEGEDAALLAETGFTQPALFAIEYAVAELWRSWGVAPTLVMGHSLGEFAAATVAGVFSLEDGLRVVAERGRLMASLPLSGMMAAVFADESTVSGALESYPDVAVAGVNGPANVVISGPITSVERLTDAFRERGIESRSLEISNAFHSPLVDPILGPFEAFVASVELREPRIPIVSNLTGVLARAGEVSSPLYWREHLRQPVLFHQGIQALASSGTEFFLETGPHGTLLGLGQECLEPGRGIWLPSLRRGRGDWEQILETVSRLYAGGMDIDWSGFDAGYRRCLVGMPTYPFQRTRYWFTAPDTKKADSSAKDWERAIKAAEQQSRLIPIDLDLPSYSRRWQTLDRLTIAHVVDAFRSLGAYRTEGEAYSADSLCERFGVVPVYRDLVGLWLARLAREGLLEQDGVLYRSPQTLEALPLAERWSEADATLVDMPPLRDYLRRCGDRLPEIITGRANALDTLFPDGSFAAADFFYRRWSLPRYFNAILCSAVSAWIGRTAERHLRIVEIGAGSGGTTATLLPSLAAAGVEYWFTDLSDHFLNRAAREFAEYPFLRFARLDAEIDPVSQGFGAGAFDVVTAANSLHATRDLGEALAHARTLLRPGGLLALYEVTRELPWFPMSIALIEGWQRHADALRPDGTLLGPERWDAALRAAGFEEVAVFPQTDSPAEILGHHIILARRPSAAGADEAQALPDNLRGVPRGLARPGGPAGVGEDGEVAAETSRSPGGTPVPTLAEQLAAAPQSDRSRLAVEYVRRHVTQVLRLEPHETPGRNDRLLELGFDSLTAVELRGRLVRALGGAVDLPSTLVFDYPTIEAIAELIRGRLEAPGKDGESTSSPQFEGQIKDDEVARERAEQFGIASLSEQQVEQLLMDKLEQIREIK